MLYWIWFFIFTALALIASHKGGKSDALSSKLCDNHFSEFGLALGFMAWFCIWGESMLPLYNWLLSVLPNKGEWIAIFTSGFLVFSLIGLYFYALILLYRNAFKQAEEKSLASQG